MEKYSATDKAQLKALKAALKKTLAKAEYWTSLEEVHHLMEMAGPFSIPATLKELGYHITDRADSGAIHIAALR
jgi:hypothetical protein